MKNNKGLIITIISIVTLISLCFCSLGATALGISVYLNSKIPQTSKSSDSVSTPTPSQDPIGTNGGINKNIISGNIEFKVSEITESNSNTYVRPRNNKKFFYVNISIRNNGAALVDPLLTNFQIQDSKEKQTQATSVITKEPAFRAFGIARNETRTGWLTFEVEKNENKFTLIYQPDPQSKNKIIVQLY